ncbi:MerR family transcriptional regulator [Paenibacillus chondroitinus]|uniref:MerR family transcriptional regulator n=1 Tax=Paenibacillus chondroitinus TaxID=59842 RepID=A0ABU6D4T1_9BACL|nr:MULTISPECIES: MerR family transcriptional regulator [Paenibacillus]MCY9660880.1 MerR family transcriptional regulator [Paenibacillus anseongense]MEB4792322.1 MerR family transcriptional regulator [Paenibacillus chondroitinus]
MQIKELAEKLNISPRTIRFYEQKGLISPHKQEHNLYRRFTEKEVWRLQTIISLREAGMTIEDIKKALPLAGDEDTEQLQYYLEMQRSIIFSQWLELKQIIETTDTMIDLLKYQQTLPLDDIFLLAEGSKRWRETRKNWNDKWNFDHQALTHDNNVVNNDREYKDYEKALQTTIDWVAPKAGERGLDIGTGTGNLAGKFLEKGISIAGIDQSKEMLKRCGRKHPQMELKLGNFLAIPYLDGQFDFIVTSFALHHISDEQKILALGEMRRVLKPHGRICITDLMFENDDQKVQYIADLERQGRTDDIQLILNAYYATSSTLLSWFDENGYITKHKQLNELLTMVYAVPIR